MILEIAIPFIIKNMVSFPFSETIYFCTHEDNDESNLFLEFCKGFLPEYTVEQTSCGNDKERVVLVLSVPSKSRFNPYQYFIDRVKDTVVRCGLKNPGKEKEVHRFCFYLSIIDNSVVLFKTCKHLLYL